jgi:hypothetical protein
MVKKQIYISRRNMLFLLFIACITLAYIVKYLYTRLEYFGSDNSSEQDTSFIQCVVARYNEKTDWFNTSPWNKIDMICYNKGPRLPENCYNNHCKVIELDNVGRCDHTYLYHIIENYDSLAPVTFFLPASCTDNHKQTFTTKVFNHLMQTKTTVLQGGILDDIRKTMYDFTLDNWSATNKENVSQNPESQLLKSPIRPFGKWYDTNFDPELKIKIFSYYGIIAVDREHIVQHPVSRYQKLLKYVDSHSNPEAGHYIERSWGAIFYPYPESCIYMY